MTENQFDGFNVEELEQAPSSVIDYSKYDGEKSVIAEVKVTTARTDYDLQGQYVQGLQREIPVLEVYSDVLGQKETGEDIRAMERLNLKINPKTNKPVYSLHEKSKTRKLFNFFKVNSVVELKGKPITVIVRTATKSDRQWLGFNY